ncbi:MAG TPA: PEP-CTERM sorting domain-containing protein [Thermoguttaceae bacterium]
MKIIFTNLMALTLALNGATIVQAEMLTFDDLPAPPIQGQAIPDDYGGFQWINYHYLDGNNNNYYPSGFQNSVVSQNNVIYNGFGSTAAIYDGLFMFNSAYFTAVCNDGLHVRVDGYKSGSKTNSQELIVNTDVPTLVNFNWPNIEMLKFTAWGGTHRYNGVPYAFAMDDLAYNVIPVPEPSALVMLAGLTVMFAIGYWRRRMQS